MLNLGLKTFPAKKIASLTMVAICMPMPNTYAIEEVYVPGTRPNDMNGLDWQDYEYPTYISWKYDENFKIFANCYLGSANRRDIFLFDTRPLSAK